MKLRWLATLLVVASMGSPAAMANLITNGGFESQLTGWTSAGGNPFSPQTYTGNFFVPPHSGAWALDLGPSGIPSENHGYAFQTVGVTAGTYFLEFWFRIETNGITSAFGLDLSGAATFSANLTSTSVYQLYSYQFLAGTGPLSIKFTDKDPGNPAGYNTLIDDVNLVQVEAPEPASGALALLGMLSLALVRTMKKRRCGLMQSV